MYHSAPIFHADNHYYFSGYNDNGFDSILRLAQNSWTWSTVGQVNLSRWGHGVIMVGDKFMIMGGRGIRKNEECLLTNGEFSCTELSSSLNDYVYTPMLFLVDESYGNC